MNQYIIKSTEGKVINNFDICWSFKSLDKQQCKISRRFPYTTVNYNIFGFGHGHNQKFEDIMLNIVTYN